MSARSRGFKRFKKDFEQRLVWNNGPDRQYGNWQLIEVNGTEMLPGYMWEFDFWCSNGKGVYILRIHHSKERNFFISKAKGKHRIIYLCAECEFEEVNDELIHRVLKVFDGQGIPKYRINEIYHYLRLAEKYWS